MKNELCKNQTGDNDMLILTPAADICETENGIVMQLVIPGARKEDISLEISAGILKLSAVSALKRNGKTVSYKREFQLPDDLDSAAVTAENSDGVLTLNIPKSERARVHKITVA